MKTTILKTTAVSLALGAALLCSTSCGDKFLTEVKHDSYTTDMLDTPEGLQSFFSAFIYSRIFKHLTEYFSDFLFKDVIDIFSIHIRI